MKTFKGTPGPWIFDEDAEILIANDEEKAVAEIVFTGDTTGYEDTFNIALIMSSPDLLSAIQHLVEVYDSEDGKQWTADSKKAAIAEARAAIDKALGEQP